MSEPGPDIPSGTYRIQLFGLNGGRYLGFEEAGELAPYLEALGVSHAYLSPILQAAPGSTHGYDVVDHGLVSEELGGLEGYRAMVGRFHEHGLQVMVDVVPNHMAVPDPPELNGPLAGVIEEGPESPYARWFDVDWEAGGGRIVLPGEGEPNYRRFFDISGLIALRQEDPVVFARTHRQILILIAEGLIDALRIDHPDGLTDPRAYLERLSTAVSELGPPLWTVVEKITTGAERLPSDWRCAGTTGYDALGVVGGLFIDPEGEEPLTDAYTAFTSGPRGFTGVEYECRRYAAVHGLRPEVARLHRVLCRVLDVPEEDVERRDDLREALVGLLAAMPVYRAYVVPGEPPPQQAMDVLEEALRRARERLPSRLGRDLDLIVRLALGHDPRGGGDGAAAEFVVRFQQTCAPVAAKGGEDTAFYRWSRMIALNEVGGDPERFSVSPEEFHEYCAEIARERPWTMTTLSTHDTKRQEDARARLAVLAELPEQWRAAVESWRMWDPKGSPMEPELEYLLWQTLVGSWPVSEERLAEFLTKAMREAKTRSSWLEPDSDYENAVLGHARRALNNAGLVARVSGFVSLLEPYARVNALGQKLVQLTMPGVPDVYQGCELTGLAMVDPDNRRPIDYDARRDRLARLDDGRPPRDLDDEKLLVTSRALRLRRHRPDWFGSAHQRIATSGQAASHAVAFLRGEALTVATRLPRGLEQGGGWADTYLEAAAARWRDVLTGEVHQGPLLGLADVLRTYPVALLVPDALDFDGNGASA
ncbi:malto-oligosyltrehalose synthase [Actinomadura sp. NBRC 104412]|uniref:malto-oligosyltrehalose synthase n=1 Tax=Actinomadura sp. NBRC 104412 TaxID=3032203 RepID=UPI0024A58921|nr:malto-oligosyltrehalose synthase [Actinomadura sp. NBRC 104412]GLZ03952.1 malto-oligosyltrehalose synthase [Actinomadura sp. NBRC 104412]